VVQRQQEEVLGPEEEEVVGGTELTRSQKRLLRRSRRTSPVLFGLIVFLVLLAGAQAVVLIPLLGGLGGDRDEGRVEVNLPEREIRVFVAAGRQGLVLKTPLDLPEADRERARDLDAYLFPGGEAHWYFLLHAANRGDEMFEVDLSQGTPVLFDEDGRTWKALDLRRVLDERAAELPEYLRLYLRLHLPEDGRIGLPANTSRDVLLAYPGDLEPAKVARAKLGEVTLEPEKVRKDDLDRILEANGGDR
jgi:hypothetical protein